MTCLERLVENGLCAIENNSYEEWLKIMVEDSNFRYTRLSIDDLWAICKYVNTQYAEKCAKLEERINAGQIETEELYEENRRLFLENKELKGE